LVKQGHQSVVCELDLKGFDAELAVISGRRSAVEVLHQIMSRHGTDLMPGCRCFMRASRASSSAPTFKESVHGSQDAFSVF